MTAYVVTVKLPRNEAHDPRNKVTAPCPVSGRECTDQTGEHHSVLVEAQSATEARDRFTAEGIHVTRVEMVEDPRSTAVTEEMLGAAVDALPDHLAMSPVLLSAGQLRRVIAAALRARGGQS